MDIDEAWSMLSWSDRFDWFWEQVHFVHLAQCYESQVRFAQWLMVWHDRVESLA